MCNVQISTPMYCFLEDVLSNIFLPKGNIPLQINRVSLQSARGWQGCIELPVAHFVVSNSLS